MGLYTQEIEQLLHDLGIGRRFAGYSMMVDAVRMALTDNDALICCKDHILQPLAADYRCPPGNLTRNLRTVIVHAWQVNPGYLCRLAGYPLRKAPSPSEFIDILASRILRGHGDAEP